MRRVYRAADVQEHRLDSFDRDRLEEFPARASLEFSLPPPLVPQEVQGHTVDHAELREELMAELRAETQAKVEQAFAEGHRRGVEAGRKEFVQSTAHAAEMLQEAAGAMAAARQEYLQSLEPQVLQLVALIAQRVLQREMRTDPDLVLNTVRRALEKIADQQKLRLRVNPADAEAIRKHRVRVLEEFKRIEEIEIQVDPEVSPGGCIAESKLMHVDARLEVLLENVLEQLRD